MLADETKKGVKKMKKTYYIIERRYDGTRESDLLKNGCDWEDRRWVEECTENRSAYCYESLDEAKKDFTKVRDDKTACTEKIIIKKCTDLFDDDGDYIEGKEEVIL